VTPLALRLPEIELVPTGAPARPRRPTVPSPWRTPPAPDIERIIPAADRVTPRPARPPRPALSPRRTNWPATPRSDWTPPPRTPAPPAPPRPAQATAAAVTAAELEIPAFLSRPRPMASLPVVVPDPAPPHPEPPPVLAARPRARGRRARPRWGRITLTAAVIAGVAAFAGLAWSEPAPGPAEGASAQAVSATAAALAEIPPDYLALYRRFGESMDIDWRFLAAIGGQESDHGRNPWAAEVNAAGCVGPMQLGVGGRCGDFVGAWGVDGDGDGRIDPRRPADAIATAARGLRLGKGAPPVGGDAEAYRQAACGYYGACSDDRADYAAEVMARAARYGFRG
jgi:hypothetical protein